MKDLSKYTLIKASAGSGKTYRLTERIAERIAGGLHPSEIIATTFTVKAAEELRSRIRERLVDDGLLGQAAQMPAALVDTVNSMAGQILGEFAFEAGLSPQLTVLSETTADQAFAEATDSIVASFESKHWDLLVRVGYDKQDPNDRTGGSARQSFAQTVSRLITYARMNNLTEKDLARSRDASLASLQQVLGGDKRSTSGVDPRRVVLEKLGEGAARVREWMKTGEIRRRSIASSERWLGEVERFITRVEHIGLHKQSWAEWLKAADFNVGGEYPAAARDACTAVGVVPVIESSAAFRSDLMGIVELVFDTAAEAMVAYAQFKEARGFIDFTDQEQRTLHLLQYDGEVRQAIRDRFKFLAVDEFQDTSPIQLALFTELAALVDEVVWVGDMKQSIYGFRDADPELMRAVADKLETDGGQTEVLGESWRTHEVPLAFNNLLFSRLFPGAPSSEARNPEVWLDVPTELKKKHTGGRVELRLKDSNGSTESGNGPWFDRVVRAVIELRNKEAEQRRTNPGSIAVLTRTNGHADRLQAALEAAGVDCSRRTTALFDTREGKLLRAALAWLLDEEDTKALAELITLMNEHPAHLTWLTDLAALPDRGVRRTKLAEWGAHPSLAPVTELRGRIGELTMIDVVDALVDGLNLRVRSTEWGRVREGGAVVAGALQAAAEYLDEAVSRHEPASLSGLLAHLGDEEGAFAAPLPEPEAVFLGTIHNAKGLEWDTVIVALGSPTVPFAPAGEWVEAEQDISLEAPLAGRSLRFWPMTLISSPELKERALAHPEQRERERAEHDEQLRLFYVALTRSRMGTILMPQNSLQALPVFDGYTVSTEKPAHHSDRGTLTIGKDDESPVMKIPITILEVPTAEQNTLEEEMRIPRLWDGRNSEPVSQPSPTVSATFTASGLRPSEALAAAAEIELLALLGDPLPHGSGDAALIGDCVHTYLATPYASLSDAERWRLAEQITARWGVEDVITPDAVVQAGDNLMSWLAENYPNARIQTEVPMVAITEDHRRAQGWMDLVVEHGDGTVVIDHKTYSGSDPMREIRQRYTAQLDVYRQVLGEGTSVLIHFPFLGQIYRVTLPMLPVDGQVRVATSL